MKYRTFVRVRAGAIALGVAALGFVGCRAVSGPASAPSAPTTTEVSVSAPANETFTEQAIETAETQRPAPTPAATRTNELTTWQREVMDMQKQPLTNGEEKGGSRKWVVNGDGLRAEFRADLDKGFDYWNRVKVDTNLNKKYEERWDFKKDGSIKRRVAPNDDENYTEEYRLKGERWVKK